VGLLAQFFMNNTNYHSSLLGKYVKKTEYDKKVLVAEIVGTWVHVDTEGDSNIRCLLMMDDGDTAQINFPHYDWKLITKYNSDL